MEQYIPKSALLAEIERMQDAYIAKLESRGMGHEEAVIASISYVNGIKDAINSLEVKEVDINKEISQFIDANFEKATIGHKLSLRRVAKHFFELGIRFSAIGSDYIEGVSGYYETTTR